MSHPVYQHAVQHLKDSDGNKLKSTTNQGLDSVRMDHWPSALTTSVYGRSANIECIICEKSHSDNSKTPYIISNMNMEANLKLSIFIQLMHRRSFSFRHDQIATATTTTTVSMSSPPPLPHQPHYHGLPATTFTLPLKLTWTLAPTPSPCVQPPQILSHRLRPHRVLNCTCGVQLGGEAVL
jgi:hypothetical protein